MDTLFGSLCQNMKDYLNNKVNDYKHIKVDQKKLTHNVLHGTRFMIRGLVQGSKKARIKMIL